MDVVRHHFIERLPQKKKGQDTPFSRGVPVFTATPHISSKPATGHIAKYSVCLRLAYPNKGWEVPFYSLASMVLQYFQCKKAGLDEICGMAAGGMSGIPRKSLY